MTVNAKNLFLVDAIGALFTSGVMLALSFFQSYIGLPVLALYALSFIAFGFFIYSLLNYLILKRNWGYNLKGIAMANMLYAVSALLLVSFYYDSVPLIIGLYFIIEAVIVIFLSVIEFKVGNWST